MFFCDFFFHHISILLHAHLCKANWSSNKHHAAKTKCINLHEITSQKISLGLWFYWHSARSFFSAAFQILSNTHSMSVEVDVLFCAQSFFVGFFFQLVKSIKLRGKNFIHAWKCQFLHFHSCIYSFCCAFLGFHFHISRQIRMGISIILINEKFSFVF